MGPDDFYYDLPASAIAQEPLVDRPAARLLDATGPSVVHRTVRDLPSLLGPGDVLVLNDTRVLPARLRLRRPTGGAAEVLLLHPVDGHGAHQLDFHQQDGPHQDGYLWEALVRPSRRLPDGVVLTPDGPVVGGTVVEGVAGLAVEVGVDLGEGRRHVRIRTSDGDLKTALDRYGEMPLPPYLTNVLVDPERYQTVFSDRPASAAAPTAGLHLTEEVLERCRSAGARVEHLELVVGLDTFRPVTVGNFDDHRMHHERYQMAPEVLEACLAARPNGGRVVAMGTTAVRALESAARFGPAGSTDLFIRPPFEFQVVDALMTNFHLPRSTLLVMLEAFAGTRWRDLYRGALDDGYRFLSFGDAMLVARTATDPSRETDR